MQPPLKKTIETCSEETWASFAARGNRTVLKLEEKGIGPGSTKSLGGKLRMRN